MLSGAHLEGYTLIRKGFIRLAEAQSELSLTETAVRVHTAAGRHITRTHTHAHTSKRLQVNRAGGDSAIGSASLVCFFVCVGFDQGLVLFGTVTSYKLQSMFVWG